MHDLISFLTSKEIIIVYIVVGLACMLCFIIYLIEKNTDKRKRRSNTRELNKLVEQIQDEVGEKEEVIYSDEPVLETIEEVKQVADSAIIVPERVEEKKEEEKLEYTTIEPDQATAKLELQKLREELEKEKQEQESLDADIVTEPVITNNYEELQEENAIISLEELIRKSKELYESNEKTQYVDDNTVPISLDELAKQAGKTAEVYASNEFAISDVVSESEIKEEMQKVETVAPIANNKVKLDDFNTIKVPTADIKTAKFKSSPIISPIYGIERRDNDTDLELENTANYEKLDQEIKKTNEFLMTLRELQKKLD